MKRLVLMRHAKSGWDDPTLDDHDRVLNGRGRSSARMLGDWLRAHDLLPDVALVSDAARTRETFERLKLDCAARLLPALYEAGPEQMLAILHRAQGETVLMIGHNPGIGWLAQNLVADAPPHPRFFDYPTGATLVTEFDVVDWSGVGTGKGRATEFIIPRELTG